MKLPIAAFCFFACVLLARADPKPPMIPSQYALGFVKTVEPKNTEHETRFYSGYGYVDYEENAMRSNVAFIEGTAMTFIDFTEQEMYIVKTLPEEGEGNAPSCVEHEVHHMLPPRNFLQKAMFEGKESVMNVSCNKWSLKLDHWNITLWTSVKNSEPVKTCMETSRFRTISYIFDYEKDFTQGGLFEVPELCEDYVKNSALIAPIDIDELGQLGQLPWFM